MTSKTAVSPINLIKSFGWSSTQLFMQQDVQEFSCILLDAIETALKGESNSPKQEKNSLNSNQKNNGMDQNYSVRLNKLKNLFYILK